MVFSVPGMHLSTWRTPRLFRCRLSIPTLRSLSWLSKGGLTLMSHYALCTHVSHCMYHSVVLLVYISAYPSPWALTPHVTRYIPPYFRIQEHHYNTQVPLSQCWLGYWISYFSKTFISRVDYTDMTNQSPKTYKTHQFMLKNKIMHSLQ